MEQLDIKSQDLPELKKTVEGLSEKPFRAKQIYEWLHKKQAESFQEMTNLSVSLREKLKRNAEKYPVEKAYGSKKKYTELKYGMQNKESK